MTAREWRTWSLSRRGLTLAIIVAIGIVAGFTNTLVAETRPRLAVVALVVALVACGALGWLGVQWYWSDPRRK